MPRDPAIRCPFTFGDSYCGVDLSKVAAGVACDKTIEDCRRHDNVVRFGGFPIIPLKERKTMPKLIIEVVAGLLPGEPIPEFTRRWDWSSEQQQRLLSGDRAAAQEYSDMAGASREYAASLEDPRKVNWVRRDWVWL